jgi:hypothetical protein
MDVFFYVILGVIAYFVLFGKKNSGDNSSISKDKKPVPPSNVSVKATVRRASSGRDYQDDLATFTVSYGNTEEKSKNKEPGKWIKPGTEIKIGGYTSSRGFFYFGGRLKAHEGTSGYYNSNETDASLIDDSLKIQSNEIYYEDESLGYWPKFSTISPSCRGAYVNWLMGNRDDPDLPIGYVFLYFYGLERRIVVDAEGNQVGDSEYTEIYAELKRLNKTYTASRSFQNYSSRLMELMAVRRPNLISLDIDSISQIQDSIFFKLHLAQTVVAGEPIDVNTAIAWLKSSPEYSLRTPARRCYSEFSAIFSIKYSSKYGDGLVIKPNKTKLRISYHSASSTLTGIDLNQGDLPDPSVLKAPVKKLIALAEECTAQLESYSRYLGKKGTSKEDIAAVLLLPDELLTEDSCPQLKKLRGYFDKAIEADKGLLPVEQLWEVTGLPIPEKMNKKELDLIQCLADKSGFGIAPDSRFHHAKPTIDGQLVVFSEGPGKFFEPGKAFNEIGMVLRLGSMVAAIDTEVDEQEEKTLRVLIDHDTKLSPVEKRSLHAYLTWRLNSPANMAGLKARLERLSFKEKTAVSHILISVVLADGVVDPREIKQLEKLYTALGLDKTSVTSDIHTLTSSKFDVTRASKTTAKANEKAGFTLNEEVLALHESETNEVQDMLGAIFIDDSVEDIFVKDTPQQSSPDELELDQKHLDLFIYLKEKEKWARSDVMEFCQSLGLMFDGALEVINDWSFEKVDAPVLDDDDDIYVDLEIVEELEG